MTKGISVLPASRRLAVVAAVPEQAIAPRDERGRVAVPRRPKQAVGVPHRAGVLRRACHHRHEGEPSPIKHPSLLSILCIDFAPLVNCRSTGCAMHEICCVLVVFLSCTDRDATPTVATVWFTPAQAKGSWLEAQYIICTWHEVYVCICCRRAAFCSPDTFAWQSQVERSRSSLNYIHVCYTCRWKSVVCVRNISSAAERRDARSQRTEHRCPSEHSLHQQPKPAFFGCAMRCKSPKYAPTGCTYSALRMSSPQTPVSLAKSLTHVLRRGSSKPIVGKNRTASEVRPVEERAFLLGMKCRECS